MYFWTGCFEFRTRWSKLNNPNCRQCDNLPYAESLIFVYRNCLLISRLGKNAENGCIWKLGQGTDEINGNMHPVFRFLFPVQNPLLWFNWHKVHLHWLCTANESGAVTWWPWVERFRNSIMLGAIFFICSKRRWLITFWWFSLNPYLWHIFKI